MPHAPPCCLQWRLISESFSGGPAASDVPVCEDGLVAVYATAPAVDGESALAGVEIATVYGSESIKE